MLYYYNVVPSLIKTFFFFCTFYSFYLPYVVHMTSIWPLLEKSKNSLVSLGIDDSLFPTVNWNDISSCVKHSVGLGYNLCHVHRDIAFIYKARLL